MLHHHMHYHLQLLVRNQRMLQKDLEATVDTDWDINPDITNQIFGQNWWCLFNNSAAGFCFYDIASGNWINKTFPTTVTISTDVILERISKSSGYFAMGNIISASGKMVTTDLTLSIKEYGNFAIEIMSGTGRGQRRRIISNTIGTNSKLTVASVQTN